MSGTVLARPSGSAALVCASAAPASISGEPSSGRWSAPSSGSPDWIPVPSASAGDSAGRRLVVGGATAAAAVGGVDVAVEAAGDHVDDRRLLARGDLAADRVGVRRERDDVAHGERAAAALAQLERGGAGPARLGHDHAVAQDRRAGVGHHLRAVAGDGHDGEVFRAALLEAQRVVGRGGAAQPEVAHGAAALEGQHVPAQVARPRELGRRLARDAVEVDGRCVERGGDRVAPGPDDHLVAVAGAVDRVGDLARHRDRAVAGGGGRARVGVARRVRPGRGGGEQGMATTTVAQIAGVSEADRGTCTTSARIRRI